MLEKIISEGKTTNEAVENGLKKLNVSKDMVEIKIIEEKKKSFFNILEPHLIKVELTLKEGQTKSTKKVDEEEEKIQISDEDLKKAENELNKFLKVFLGKISPNIKYDIKIQDEAIYVELTGKESTKLIGYRGEALNSLQLILSNIIKKHIQSSIKIILDVENYREKRKTTLEELAKKIEKTVSKTGKKITLEPMNSYDRKIIHTMLQNSEQVRTYSIGEDESRRIVIAKK